MLVPGVIGGSGGTRLVPLSRKEKLSSNLGEIIRQRRVIRGLTLGKLGTMSGVSESHLGRVERGERFPSAHILRKIAKPLGFEESELFYRAGFLSPAAAESQGEHNVGQFDPHVARVLAQEPVEVQRAVIAILTILKNIAKSMTEK